MRRGHAGAAQSGIAAVLVGREDADARPGNIDVRPEVGEAGEEVGTDEFLVRDPARLSVGVGDRRDGEDLVVSCGNESGGITAAIPGCHDVDDAFGHGATDRLVHDVVVCLAAVAVVGARSGQAHVYRRDVVGGVAIGACTSDEVDPAGHAREGTEAARIEYQRFAPGATPTTPIALSMAATVPAT